MKNIILVSVSVTAIMLAFLLREANIAIDASDEYTYQAIKDAFRDGCLQYSEGKSIIECSMDAEDYLRELRERGW